jgi:hypothetical protein
MSSTVLSRHDEDVTEVRCSATMAEVFRVLGLLAPAAADADLDACSVDQLQQLADAIADGRRTLDGLATRVGMAADRLAASSSSSAENSCGHSPGRVGAADVLRGSRNRARSSSVRKDAERAKAAAALGKVGAAVEQGLLGGDQLDSFARACRGLSPEEQQALNTDEMVDAAVTMPGDIFDRTIREAARRARADRGLADTKAKQDGSEFHHWFDEESGMGRFNGRLDPERYERLIGAIEKRAATLANQGGVTKSPNLVAAALVDLVDGAGQRHGGRGTNLSVIVDLETLRFGPHEQSTSETAGGFAIPPESLARLACDVHEGGWTVRLDPASRRLDIYRPDGQWQAAAYPNRRVEPATSGRAPFSCRSAAP